MIAQMPPDAIAGFGSVGDGSNGGGAGGAGAKGTAGGGMDVDGDDEFMDAVGAPSCSAEGKDDWNGGGGGGGAKGYK